MKKRRGGRACCGILRNVVPALLAVALFLHLGRQSAAAPQPLLSLTCGARMTQAIVTCRLSGHGFRPREAVRIVYRLTIDLGGTPAHPAAPKKRRQLHVYVRRALINKYGSFHRPPLRFTLGSAGYAFRLQVVVRDQHGDRAGVTVRGGEE